MLVQYLPQLANSRVVLASASPRRAELLRSLGLTPEIVPSTFGEDLDKSTFATPGDYAVQTAVQKALAVSRLSLTKEADQRGRRVAVIIAADTVVEVAGRLLEKPCNDADAFGMLRSLSGKRHTVHTGVALLVPPAPRPTGSEGPVLTTFQEQTEVEFAPLENDDISAYIATGEPVGKAGAYGIQGIGGTLVKRINGCYFNVMGLPLHRLSQEMTRLLETGQMQLSP